jgi:Na+-transporting methylmalonyl-CoA/oxaloacetate decarboxylase gamma subunit
VAGDWACFVNSCGSSRLSFAYAAEFFGGRVLVPITRPFFKMPDFVLSALAGALLAFVAYAVVSSMGTVLFKRTGEQDSRVVKLIYGFAGAILGLFFVFFALWLIVVSVRVVGAVADAQVRTRTATPHAYPDAASYALEVRRRFLGDGGEHFGKWVAAVG